MLGSKAQQAEFYLECNIEIYAENLSKCYDQLFVYSTASSLYEWFDPPFTCMQPILPEPDVFGSAAALERAVWLSWLWMTTINGSD